MFPRQVEFLFSELAFLFALSRIQGKSRQPNSFCTLLFIIHVNIPLSRRSLTIVSAAIVIQTARMIKEVLSKAISRLELSNPLFRAARCLICTWWHCALSMKSVLLVLSYLVRLCLSPPGFQSRVDNAFSPRFETFSGTPLVRIGPASLACVIILYVRESTSH